MSNEAFIPLKVYSLEQIVRDTRFHFEQLSRTQDTTKHMRAISDLGGVCLIAYRLTLKDLQPELFGLINDVSILGVTNRTKFERRK